jgi:hypothetical protein
MNVPRCVGCYEPVGTSVENLVIAPAGAICAHCTRLVRSDDYWIYVGGLFPVVVRAKNQAEAVEKLKKNDRYDRLGERMITVAQLERDCRERS